MSAIPPMRIPHFAFVIALTVLVGCDASETEALAPLTRAEVADGYVASTFQLAAGPDTTDVLAGGGSLSITLSEGGEVSGRLFVPEAVLILIGEADEAGGDLDESLAGTYTIVGTDLFFDMDSDTFVRDLPWRYEDGHLHTTGAMGEGGWFVLEMTR